MKKELKLEFKRMEDDLKKKEKEIGRYNSKTKEEWKNSQRRRKYEFMMQRQFHFQDLPVGIEKNQMCPIILVFPEKSRYKCPDADDEVHNATLQHVPTLSLPSQVGILWSL